MKTSNTRNAITYVCYLILATCPWSCSEIIPDHRCPEVAGIISNCQSGFRIKSSSGNNDFQTPYPSNAIFQITTSPSSSQANRCQGATTGGGGPFQGPGTIGGYGNNPGVPPFLEITGTDGRSYRFECAD